MVNFNEPVSIFLLEYANICYNSHKIKENYMARTLTKSFTPAVILSGFIGSLSCFAGGIISGFNNHIPTGAATTVILAVPLLFLAYFSSKKIKDNSK